MTHIILCGDSIFDNQPYINAGEQNVTNQVESLLAEGSRVTRLALDGDITTGIKDQLRNLPDDATHLFISVGGNDALSNIDQFTKEVKTVGEALTIVNDWRNTFQVEYSKMMQHAMSFQLPITVCTIYYPRFNAHSLGRVSDYLGENINGESLQKVAMAALSVFNDIITKEAFQIGIPVIDLRILCNDDSDFANPIEPSEAGGQKIAEMIQHIAFSYDFSQNTSTVFC